jgi:hypothetical protein
LLASAAIVLLTACGSPARVQTLDHTGDFGSAAAPLTRPLPSGLGAVGVDGPRLRAGCVGVGSRVAALVPGVGANAAVFTGRHCEWKDSEGTAVIVGMIEQSGAAFTLDETRVYVDDEQTIPGIGRRAVYDPQTHALYVIIGNRLWYVQLVGAAADSSLALQNVNAIGRALANTPGAQ